MKKLLFVLLYPHLAFAFGPAKPAPIDPNESAAMAPTAQPAEGVKIICKHGKTGKPIESGMTMLRQHLANPLISPIFAKLVADPKLSELKFLSPQDLDCQLIRTFFGMLNEVPSDLTPARLNKDRENIIRKIRRYVPHAIETQVAVIHFANCYEAELVVESGIRSFVEGHLLLNSPVKAADIIKKSGLLSDLYPMVAEYYDEMSKGLSNQQSIAEELGLAPAIDAASAAAAVKK